MNLKKTNSEYIKFYQHTSIKNPSKFQTRSNKNSIDTFSLQCFENIQSRNHHQTKCSIQFTACWWACFRAYKSWKAIHFFSIDVRKGLVESLSYKLLFTYCLIINPAFSVTWKTKRETVSQTTIHSYLLFFKIWNILSFKHFFHNFFKTSE